MIAAFWDLLKFTSDENEKGVDSEYEDALVSNSETTEATITSLKAPKESYSDIIANI